MDVEEYLRHDGLGLAELVASGQVTPSELLATARARAEAVNPAINAIVAWLDDHADQRVAGELSGPFAGVPFLLKDLHQDLAGTVSNDGCRALAGRKATKTDTVVQRWLDAGLVIFGKTNTPEFGSKGVTEPDLFGPSRNPWDTRRTPGGSSGGSAAAVAAGILPVAAASDGGGSIRIPAACNGLVGLKAGRGMMPTGPVETEQFLGMATNGVISRTVRDSAAMFDALVGPEPVSPCLTARPERPLLEQLDEAPGKLRIGYSTRCALREQPHPEAVRAVERSAELLTELGHEVEEVAPPHDDRQLGRDFLLMWFVRQAADVERIKRETGCGDEGFELDTLVMAALGRATGGIALHDAQERRREHVAALADFHSRYDLLLTPSLGEPPIEVGSLDTPAALRSVVKAMLKTRTTRVLKLLGTVEQIVDNSLRWVPYTQLANLTGRPAISLPLHRTDAGLPLGVQFVGPPSSEGLLLRLARQLEVAAPWERPTPLLEAA
ncbi:amidase [Saccharopolyspora flava]|uniref:Asp-tRNAAsn/Glu-tRNAGln amidotransferase A subunit n=1 Tax=Saccharopolyspora flava TaxID=95161 RepID=A0A1I6U760_9PSEU|nr:amidase [Saccharopolyspora flava]SFS97178.1 Asp-tRNAAsn/Glu-tRNAGln amidotransferase A subunit [Saccharopolyspora flava]